MKSKWVFVTFTLVVICLVVLFYRPSSKQEEQILTQPSVLPETTLVPGAQTNHTPQPKTETPDANFKKLAETVKSEIPSKASLQKHTDQEVHYTPEEIQKAAIGIGQIAQEIADKPELSQSGLAFYKECAEEDKNPTSIRASCYVNYENLRKQSGLNQPSLKDDLKINEQVKALASKLL